MAGSRFDLQHVALVDMAADGLTKALPREHHARFVSLLGMAALPLAFY